MVVHPVSRYDELSMTTKRSVLDRPLKSYDYSNENVPPKNMGIKIFFQERETAPSLRPLSCMCLLEEFPA